MRRYLMDKREQKRVKKIFSEHKKNETQQTSVPRFLKDDPTIKELEMAKYELLKYSKEQPAYKGLKKQLLSQDIDIKMLRMNRQKGSNSNRSSQTEDGFATYRQRGSQIEAFLKNTRNLSFCLQIEEQLPNVKQGFKDQTIRNYVYDSQARRNKLKQDRLKSQEREFNVYNSMSFNPTQRRETREKYLAYKFDPELPYLTAEKFCPKSKVNKRYNNHTSEEGNQLFISNNNIKESKFTENNALLKTTYNQKLSVQKNIPIKPQNSKEIQNESTRRSSVVSHIESTENEVNLAQAIEDQRFIESVFNSKESSNKKMQKILQSNKSIIQNIKENCNYSGLFTSLKGFSVDKRIQNKELTDMLQQINSNRERTLQKKRELYQELFHQSAQASPHKKKHIRQELNRSLQQVLQDNKRQKKIFKELIEELHKLHKNIPEDVLDALDELGGLLKDGKILFPENFVKIQILLDNYGTQKEPFLQISNTLQLIAKFDYSQLTNRSLDMTIQSNI